MEYIGLSNQQNTYPSVSNYKETGLNEISLFGNYQKNILKFNIPKLSDLKVVKNTSFKFLLEIKENTTSETSLGIFTSPFFYTELATSINESNPYFINSAFLSEFLVTFYLDDTKNIFIKMQDEERAKDISFSKNIFIDSNSEYNLDSLVKYIDWVVSLPKLSDIENNGVIPAIELSSYTLPEIKIKEKIPSAEAIEVGEETVQIFQFQYKRVRDLVREELWVFKNTPLDSYRGNREQFKKDRLYKLKEGDKFFGQRLTDGSYTVFDNEKTAVIGYLEKRDPKYDNPIVVVGGPFYAKIKVVNPSNNSKQISSRELIEIDDIILQIEEQLKTGKYTNTNLFKKLGLVYLFPLSLLTLIGNRKRKEEAKQKLEQKLKEYKTKKAFLEKQLNISSTTTTIIGAGSSGGGSSGFSRGQIINEANMTAQDNQRVL